MYTNNNMGYYNNQMYGGYAPNNVNYMNEQPIKVPQFRNLLNSEQMKLLQDQNTKFNLSLTPLEIAKARCTHCNNNGIVLEQLTNGDFYCPICRETFCSIELLTDDVLKNSIDNLSDAIQYLKTMNVVSNTVPDQAMAEYSNILPLINKFPTLWKSANKDWANIYNPGFRVANNQNLNPFLTLSNIVSPTSQYGMGTYGNPYPNPAYMNNMNMNMNPGYYGAPQQQNFYDPSFNQQGYGYQPNMNMGMNGFAQQGFQNQGMMNQGQPMMNPAQQNAGGYYPNGSNPLDISSQQGFQNQPMMNQGQQAAAPVTSTPTMVNTAPAQEAKPEVVQQHKTFSM